MADTNIYVQSGDGRLVPVDTRNAPNGDQRQVFLLGDGENEGLLSPATEETLAALVAAVGTRLAAGDAVELGPAALAALETITAAVSGTVELGATSLAALENITATVSGPVEVDNASGGPLGVKQTGVAPPLGYQQIATLTASQALPTIPGGAVTAIVTPRAPVRWRDDGTAPTAGVGMYLAADQALTYQGNLAAVRLIAVSGSVEVNVAYYGAEA